MAAADDSNGSVMMLNVMDGPIIRTSRREFTEGGNVRAIARWRAALEALVREGLVEDRSGNGELFYVTHNGFALAERLRGLE